MPRIDPAELLRTLSVLLGPQGGIKSEDEVSRLVQLMKKFSTKLVSKVVYIKILESTAPPILDKFMNQRGWDLLNFWFSEAIRTCNWPLCKELLQLFQHIPMTANRLKENPDQNIAPKLVRQLVYDPKVQQDMKDLAQQVLEKWMSVATMPVLSPTTAATAATTSTTAASAATVRTRARGQRAGTAARSLTPVLPAEDEDLTKMKVTVVTEADEMIGTPKTFFCKQVETEYWVGKMGKTLKIQARKAKAPKPKVPKPVPVVVGDGEPDPLEEEFVPEEEEEDSDDDDDIGELMKRANNALNRKYGKPEPKPVRQVKTMEPKKPSSPMVNEVCEMSTGGMNGMVKDELVDDLLKEDDDEDDKPLKVLQGLADQLADDLQQEKSKEKEEKERKEKEERREKQRLKDKENKKDKHKDKERDKDRDRERDKVRDKDKDRNKYRSKEDEKRRREKEDRRRKEKERERHKERDKGKESKEKKRESKPFKETEMRNGLDSKEREKIKKVAQMMKDSLKDESSKKSSDTSKSISSLGKIPKKKPEDKEDPSKKAGLSFEALMGAMDGSKTTKSLTKAPPIKNKNKDLLASFSSPSSASIKPKPSLSKPAPPKDFARDLLRPMMRTEDKSSKIVSASDLAKAGEKRAAESDPVPKIKIKSPQQLKESAVFGDFLSTIIKDQPKKKKIKIAELKAKTLEEEEKEKKEKEKKEMACVDSPGAEPALAFSFYRDTLLEGGETTAVGNGDVVADQPEDEPMEQSVSPPPVSSPFAAVSSPKDIDDLPFLEPAAEDVGPREVRGILVLHRGAGRRNRKLLWRPETDLVQVEYFELDETERVNVNKLKFEEMKKKEFEMEKESRHQQHQVAAEESRPWPQLEECEFPPLDIEFGGQSKEKVTQEQRENSVLQALHFGNKPLNDPSEPESGSNVRFETKMVPLDDDSGEETYADYSDFGWPLPLPDLFSRHVGAPAQAASKSPATDAIFANIQQKVQAMMGSAGAGMENGNFAIESAMFAAQNAAQKAAEEELRKQGLLPPSHGGLPGTNQPQFPFDDQQFPQEEEQPYDPGEEPYDPIDSEYGGFGNGGLLGQHPQQQFQPHFPPGGELPPKWNNHLQRGGGKFRGNKNIYRGFDHRGRGGFFRGAGRGREGRKDAPYDKEFRGVGGERRPCRFWKDRGFCRDGDHCRFIHEGPPRR